MKRRLRQKQAIWVVLTLGAVFFFQTKTFAGTNAQTEVAASARGLAMGDAVINSERGPFSTFYNPANIAAKNTGTTLQIVNFQLDGNDGYLSQLATRNGINFFDLQSIADGLQRNRNKYVGGRFSIYPNFTIRNLSIGMLYEVNRAAELNSDGVLRIKTRDRFAPTAALSFRLFSGIFRFGWMSQILTVGQADTSMLMPQNTSTLAWGKSANAAMGFSHTAGTTITLPIRFLPSFSGVVRNVGATKFSQKPWMPFGDGRDVPTAKMGFDLAYGMTIYAGKYFELKPEVDLRDFTATTETSRMQRLSYGAELIAFDMLRFRVGMNAGYMSYGFGFHTRRSALEIAAYGDEIGGRLRERRDQRFVLQYTYSMFR